MRTIESVLFSAVLMLFSTAGLAQSTPADPTPINDVCTTHDNVDGQAVSTNCREALQRIGKRGLRKACAGTLLERYYEKVTEFLAVCNCPQPKEQCQRGSRCPEACAQ